MEAGSHQEAVTQPSSAETFDQNARRYYEELNQGLKLSGEGADYFAEHRVQVTCSVYARWTVKACQSVLDYGCGIGTANPFLRRQFPDARTWGFDVATEAIGLARQNFPETTWVDAMSALAADSIDLVYCNGVFHHIDPSLRDGCLQDIVRVLRPGGVFCLWENNPWNPGTRWIMSRVPFDRDAICLAPPETRQRLLRSGLQVRERQFHFWFPRSLSFFRFLEPWLIALPLGGQYLVVAQKPGS